MVFNEIQPLVYGTVIFAKKKKKNKSENVATVTCVCVVVEVKVWMRTNRPRQGLAPALYLSAVLGPWFLIF